MENIILAKVLVILSGMLLITTICARLNKAFETFKEAITTIIGIFFFLILIYWTSDNFPINIISTACFSGFIGWSLGPTIGYFGNRYKFRKFLKSIGVKEVEVVIKEKHIIAKVFGSKDETKKMFYFTDEPFERFDKNDVRYQSIEKEFNHTVISADKYNQEWQNTVLVALLGTTLSVLVTALIVYFSDTDFGFMGKFLFISLISLIVISLLNIFIYKSRLINIMKAFAGVIIFTLYLIYDFNVLEKTIKQGDDSWSTAIELSVAIYLDIVNLFLDLLEILSELS